MKRGFTQDFFYQVGHRKEPGVDWGRNPSLPGKVRMCRTGVSLPVGALDDSPDVEFLFKIQHKNVNGRVVDKGVYSIGVGKCNEWKKSNGVYVTRRGGQMLVIPLVMCTKVRGGDVDISEGEQLSLFKYNHGGK